MNKWSINILCPVCSVNLIGDFYHSNTIELPDKLTTTKKTWLHSLQINFSVALKNSLYMYLREDNLHFG